jgi:poly(A) polymerase
MALFRRTVPVGVSFGVVRVLGPTGAGEVEVATFRSDDRYEDGRRPVSVTFTSAEVDASRRDFTINGMFLDPLSDTVIDHVGGRDDLAAGVLRAIGDPARRFDEDKLRLLRAVRFAARFGFAIEPATWAALTAMAEQVHVVAPERIAQELRRMLTHGSRVRGLELALESRLIAAILPEVDALRGVPIDPGVSEGVDLWTCALSVLDALPGDAAFELALAALLCDVAVPLARASGVREPDQITRLGRDRALALATDLKLSNASREAVAWLVEHQESLAGARGFPHARLKRLLARPLAPELIALAWARASARGADPADAAFAASYRKNAPAGPLDPPPLISGREILALGARPGPGIARLLETLRDAQLDGQVASPSEALDLARRLLDSGA